MDKCANNEIMKITSSSGMYKIIYYKWQLFTVI